MANYDLDLNGNWLFHEDDFDRKARMAGDEYHASSKAGGALRHLKGFNDRSLWREVTLPHDWLTELPIDGIFDATPGCKRRGVAWYRKFFSLPDEEIECAELIFDGVLGECQVFVNGVLAKRNFSGYNRFSAEIGDYLFQGADNDIAVFVDARRHEGWWYEGAGIYRPVRLSLHDRSHIVRKDCFIRTKGNEVIADLHFVGNGTIKASLTDKDGKKIASAKAVGEDSVSFKMQVDAPARWSPENPNLYTFDVSLEQNGKESDRVTFSVGFRDIEWVENSGMHLDGKPYRIKGICAHQDHAGLGAAVYEDVEEYRILRLKSLGANAYRCAHHAPSESLLDICDRLGVLVMVENRHFDVSEDTLAQLDALVNLSRNHPCVFMYCMFNEEPWQAEARGKRIVAKLRERVLSLDGTRAVTAAQNGGVLLRHNASEALDVIGMNYNLDAYESCHTLLPQKVILGTENSPTFATRGVYKTDRERQIFADDGSEYPADFSQPLNETMATVEKYPFVAGCFVWSGFDHGGEPNPFEYPSVSSHWGFLDRCGFDKNIANWLRAYYLDEPFLRLATFADAPDVGERRVIAYTNADEGELFADGISFGKKKAENRILTWDVPAGCKELLVIAQKDGKIIRDNHKNPGQKSKLCVTDVSRGKKVRILNICVTDEDGNAILSENGTLYIDGEILGVGNGDPNGHHNDKANEINLFNGMAQLIVPKYREITISYDRLEPVVIKELA